MAIPLKMDLKDSKTVGRCKKGVSEGANRTAHLKE